MARSDFETIDNDYFRYHFFALKVLGVPVRSIRTSMINIFYQIYCLILFITIYVYFPIAEILYVAYNADLENATVGVTYICSHSLATLKGVLMMIFRKKITSFCERIETKPFSPDLSRGGTAEFSYVNDAIKSSNYQVYFFHTFVIAIVLPKIYQSLRDTGYDASLDDPFGNATLIRHTRTGPFNCVMPFNIIDSPYFEIAACYQAASAAILGFSIGAVDAIICGIMCHIKAQLLILENCLNTFIQRGIYLMEEDNPDNNSEVNNFNTVNNNSTEVQKIPSILEKYVDMSVNDIIKHHQRILQLAEDAEDTFSLLMLVQFLFSLTIICCQLFQLSILKMGSAQFYSMCFYTWLMLFQIFIFCYRGNEVMLQSYALIDAIYESNWLEISTKTQKSLLLMMTRTCRPIRLTAGKFVFLSLQAFMSIVRGSGSYFMVLRNVNMPQE